MGLDYHNYTILLYSEIGLLSLVLGILGAEI